MATKSGGALPSVWHIAVLSRVVMLCLMLGFDTLLDDYDTSGRLFPDDGFAVSTENNAPFTKTCAAVQGLVTWDAVYFLRIADVGYEHEQTHAFFPGWPLLIRAVATMGTWVVGTITQIVSGDSALLGLHWKASPSKCAAASSALFLSNAAHVCAVVLLQKLGTVVLQDPDAARSAAVLFTMNPASAFHSAGYTESVFSFFSFFGFWLLTFETASARNAAALFFALGCFTRSNGVLNGLLLLHDFVTKVLPAVGVVWPASAVPVANLFEALKKTKRKKNLVCATAVFLCRCLVTAAPLFLVQWFGYRTYCTNGRTLNPGTLKPNPKWCQVWRPFPNIYAHVQREYWNVGFLKYYQAKQLPNFLLAAPALLVSCFAAWRWVQVYLASLGDGGERNGREVCEKTPWRGEVGKRNEKGARRRSARVEKRNENVQAFENQKSIRKDVSWMLASSVRPYLWKWFLMATVSLLVMHVQVTTRFLSVTPGVYWFIAKQGLSGDQRFAKTWRVLAAAYFASFFFLGALLFPTFYPWT
jgi:phosphatidylinositol glycan class V